MKKRKKMKKAAKKSYATPVFNKFQSRLRAGRIGEGRGSTGKLKRILQSQQASSWPVARAALKCAARSAQRIFAK